MVIEALLVIVALYYCATNFIVETKHAAAGTTSPRMQLKMAKLRAAGQPVTQPRYGTKRYFQDLWSDSLERATASRRAKLASKDTKVKEADLSAAVDEALAVVAAAPEPVKVAPVRKEVQARSVPNNVVPMFKVPPPIGDDMTEVLGLIPAIEYAKSTAVAHEAHSTARNEQLVAYLQSSQVSGATISSVHEAQEASAMAAAAWSSVAKLLESQMSVKEAYDANPDAGSKEFLQGGQ